MGRKPSKMSATMMLNKPIARVNVSAQRIRAGQMNVRASPSLAPRTSLAAFRRSTPVRRAQRLVVRAEETEVVEGKATAEDDFEAKLAALKGSRRAGAGSKAEVIFEGKPAVGDLITNIALGATLLWLPLTFAAVGRFQWLTYKFTDMRIVMESSAPFESGITQVTYDQIKKVVTIGRGVGLWGDMVVTLKNGENVEFRSLEKFKELEAMINEKIGAIESTQNADPKGF